MGGALYGLSSPAGLLTDHLVEGDGAVAECDCAQDYREGVVTVSFGQNVGDQDGAGEGEVGYAYRVFRFLSLKGSRICSIVGAASPLVWPFCLTLGVLWMLRVWRS